MKSKNTTLGARAESTGVIIYLNDFEHHEIGFKASVNPEDGKVTTTRIFNNFTELTAINRANSELKPSHLLLFLAITIGLTFFSVKAGIVWLPMAICYLFAFGLSNSLWALKTFYKIKYRKDPETISQAKYHAAVHKALNAYENLERVPTLEEVQRESMYSYNCESLFFLTKSVFFVIMDIIYVLVSTNLLTPIALFLMFPMMFLFMGKKIKVFSKFEKLILLEPEEKEINCAIEAIKDYENYKYWRND